MVDVEPTETIRLNRDGKGWGEGGMQLVVKCCLMFSDVS